MRLKANHPEFSSCPTGFPSCNLTSCYSNENLLGQPGFDFPQPQNFFIRTVVSEDLSGYRGQPAYLRFLNLAAEPRLCEVVVDIGFL